MHLLVFHVIQGFGQYRFADRECSISALPSKLLVSIIYCFDPSAAISFHLFDKMGYGFSFRQLTKQMNVVGYSSNMYCLAACGVDKLTHIGVETFQMLFFDKWASGLDMKDDVKVYFAERLGHSVMAFALSGR